MTVLQWRRRPLTTPPAPKAAVAPISWLAPGEYAGRARFRPSDGAILTPALQRAIGQVVEVRFAGMAAHDEPFAGQALYVEWRHDKFLDGCVIPTQDLEFID
jgi:hypothetical protein